LTSYTILRARRRPELRGLWSGRSWGEVPSLEVAQFHPAGTEHRPLTRAKLQFDQRYLYVHFRVQDRFVRAVSRRFQDPVWADSCVELFVRPRPDRGYFNFEMNCGGVLLLYYIEDPARTADGFVKYRRVDRRELRGLRVFHTLPRRVEPELPGPLTWAVEYRVPFSLFGAYLGSPPETSGASWRGNLFKCADACSHPHWASWAPIGEELNFHQPERFGLLTFQG
jgi:Carbohydrate-binding family 9